MFDLKLAQIGTGATTPERRVRPSHSGKMDFHFNVPNEPVNSESETLEASPPTAPSGFSVSARAFGSVEHANHVASLVWACVHELSRHFELSQLDGVTVAFDYAQALLDLDRGYKTAFELKPSDSHVVGIAMTPSVIRDGSLKSHIVLNAAYLAPLEDENHESFSLVLHLIAHECAHVGITHNFETAFPGFLLRTAHTDVRIAYRWQVILGCWDEYAATLLSAGFGAGPTEGYEDAFLKSLRETKSQGNEAIKAFRKHGNVNQLLGEVYAAYGNLMKFSAYHAGNLGGLKRSVSEMPRTAGALEGHWFAPYFSRLVSALQDIARDYGAWTDKASFEVVGDLADELLAQSGVYYVKRPDGRMYVDVPFTPETLP